MGCWYSVFSTAMCTVIGMYGRLSDVVVHFSGPERMTMALCDVAVVVGVVISLWLPVPCSSWITIPWGYGLVGGTAGRSRTTGATTSRTPRTTAATTTVGARLAGVLGLSSSSSEQPPLMLPNNYQSIGDKLIREAGKQCGAHDLTIEWKNDKIKVVVLGDAFVSNPRDDDNDDASILLLEGDDKNDETDLEVELNEDDDDVDEDDEESMDDSPMFDSLLSVSEDDEENDTTNNESIPKGVDVVELARAINAALDQDSTAVGRLIAERYEIEVTTPGAPDELSGIMWQVYQGFDVICQHQDPKTKNIKTIEGRLHERTEEFTVINIKGRMKKLKNIDVRSVKLPKAKKEKGGGI
jgi:ribosome maturation factor RimP